MVRPTDDSGPTRRAYANYGGAVAAGRFLADCSGANTTDATPAETGVTGGHSVRLSPIGNVAFDRVPETAFTVFPRYTDVAVALGHVVPGRERLFDRRRVADIVTGDGDR